MAATISGAEFKRFYDDAAYWADSYHEDAVIEVDGRRLESFDESDIPDTALVRIVEGGWVEGADGTNHGGLDDFFDRWKRAQTKRRLVVECDVAAFEAVRAAVEAAGGCVMS